MIFFMKKHTTRHSSTFRKIHIPVNIHLFKVNNRNTRQMCEICSKFTIKTQERRKWHRHYIYIANVEHISYLLLVFLLFTSNKWMFAAMKPPDIEFFLYKSAIVFIIFWDFLIVEITFLSLQLKRSMIISNKPVCKCFLTSWQTT